MKLKRLLCWGMAMALACSSLPQGTVLAEEVSSQEEEADVKLQYEELEDGTLEVRAEPGETYQSLEIPSEIDGKSVSRIASHGFDGCSSLTEVVFPSTLKSMGNAAFSGCGLTEVALPEGLESIEGDPFPYCRELEKVTVSEGNPAYAASEDGALYTKDMTKLICCPGKMAGKFEVAATVTSISGSAFYGCGLLESVQLPKGYENLMIDMFNGCSSLKEIIVDEENAVYASEGGLLLNKAKDTVLVCPTGREDLEIPAGVTALEQTCLMSCTPALKILSLPKSVSSIRESLELIPDLILIVEKPADGEEASYAEKYAIDHQMKYYYSREEIPSDPDDPDDPDDPIVQQDYQFRDIGSNELEIIKYTGTATELVLPSEADGKKVVSIGDKAFANQFDLQRVEIPQGITSIGSGAFQNCLALAEVVPAAAPSQADGDAAQGGTVGEGAFQNCIRLSRVVLPAGFTKIGDRAFQSCYLLSGITLPMGITAIGNEAFSGCTRLSAIVLPEGVTEIGDMAFQSCEALVSITMPESTEKVGRFAFVECLNLKLVILPQKVANIGYDAFGGCHKDLGLGVIHGSYAANYARERGMAYYYTQEPVHNYSKQEVLVEPTCTAQGEKRYTCIICDSTYTEPIAALGHHYQTSIQKATTQKDGSTIQQCSRCDSRMETAIARVKSVVLSAEKYTYNGSAKKPTVTVTDSSNRRLREGTDYSVSYPSGRKKVGSYTVKVQLKGNYSGTVQKAFTIEPKGTSISKVSGKSKGFTMKWKKQDKEITGYQIQYSTSSKFTKKTTGTLLASKKVVSRSATKLKAKKKYYIRIRTYHNVEVAGKKTSFYSSWSKVKSVTTKK